MMKEVDRLGTLTSDIDEDEEEDDRETLIPQNSTKPISNSNHFDALNIGDELDFRRHRRCLGGLKDKKRYTLAILIPLVVVIVYVTVDFGRLFGGSGIWDVKFVGGSLSIDRMRESELRALYLLRQQRLGLFSLLNRGSGSNETITGSNSTESGVGRVDFEGVKSEIYIQIDMNKQIQQVLLSAHKDGNVSESGVDDGDSVIPVCRKADQNLFGRKAIEWKPRSDKYLFAICVSGQMSNHLICLEKHMFFAAILNRVLVIPSPKVDFQFNRVLDVDHINKCLERKVVVTYEEFYELKKKNLRINKFICYFSSPDHCYLDDDHVKKLKVLGLSMPKLESPWQEDVKQPCKRTVQDIEAKFSSDDEVIAIGDVFFADVEKDWVVQPRGPIAHKCKTLIEPSRLIILTAQRFIQTFLGRDFVALHFRRHGFLKFCNNKEPSCFFPTPQAADCMRRVVERANSPVIYLSTDAAESETGLLQSLITIDGKPVPLVTRPPRNLAEKWDALLYRHGLDGDPRVEAMLDKTICAMSSAFIGSSGSTFTEDILRLRKDWGSASSCDEYLCQGEVPNFKADAE
ncbi:O-fucosyltransferase 5-like protein [Drosera capensis]